MMRAYLRAILDWADSQPREETALEVLCCLCLALILLAVAVLVWDRGGLLPAWPE